MRKIDTQADRPLSYGEKYNNCGMGSHSRYTTVLLLPYFAGMSFVMDVDPHGRIYLIDTHNR